MLSLLSGCQLPLVPVHNYTFEASFIADGRQYSVSTTYQCHYEDMARLSMVGPDWHIRKGLEAVRIIGQLGDGSPFEILPPKATSDILCSEHVGPIASQLYIATADGGAISVDSTTSGVSPHGARLINSSLSLVSKETGVFLERQQWPSPTRAKRHFYTVQAVYYDASMWMPDQTIAKLVANKSVRWLDDEKDWPFNKWTDDDVAFARAREGKLRLNEYANVADRFPAALVGAEWKFIGPAQNVTVWRPALVQSDVMHTGDPVKTQWVEYFGHRIELPLNNFERIFYEPRSQRLVNFRAVYVDLW